MNFYQISKLKDVKIHHDNKQLKDLLKQSINKLGNHIYVHQLNLD